MATESALRYCLTFTHSRTRSHTDGGVSHAGRQPARQRAVRVRCLAQGHLNTQLLGAVDRMNNLLVTSRPALPPGQHAGRSREAVGSRLVPGVADPVSGGLVRWFSSNGGQ